MILIQWGTKMNELKKNLLKNAKIETSKKTVKVSVNLKRETNRKLWSKIVDLELKVWLNDNGYDVGKILKRGAVSNFESDDNLSEVFLFEKKQKQKVKKEEKKTTVVEEKLETDAAPLKSTSKTTKRTRRKKTKEE